MMKFRFIFIFLVYSLSVNAQRTFLDETKGLSIGVVGSPVYYFCDFSEFSGVNHKYESELNFSAGISLEYQFLPQHSLKSGLLYSTKNYHIDYDWTPISPNDPSIPQKTIMKITYLDVPLQITKYFWQREGLVFFSSSGFVVSFLNQIREVSEMGDGSYVNSNYTKNVFPQTISKTLVAFDVDFGLKSKLGNDFYLTFAPYVRCGLNRISDQAMENNPTYVGANLGVCLNMR